MTEKIKVQLSNFRVEEQSPSIYREPAIVVDVEAGDEKGRVVIPLYKLAITSLFNPNENMRDIARRVLRREVEGWAFGRGLVNDPAKPVKMLAGLVETSLKGIRAVDVGGEG